MNTKTRVFGWCAAPALAVALIGSSLPTLAAQPKNPSSADCYPSWGHGMGPGMMSGYGMGPGMMGGYGMGPGMMGGYGMGPGMMGGYWGRDLDLTDEQQTRIRQIRDETRKSRWALMGDIMDQQTRLHDLYEAPKRDQGAIDETYKTIGKLQQQVYDSSVAAQKRVEAVLTKEQQEKLRSSPRRGRVPDK